MPRFKIVDFKEAQGYDDPNEYAYDTGWNDAEWSYYLVDTKTNEVIYADGGEPEDMTLTRNLGFFVDKMNEVADE